MVSSISGYFDVVVKFESDIMVLPDSMNLALWQTLMLLGKIVYLAEVNISKCLEKDIARKILLERNEKESIQNSYSYFFFSLRPICGFSFFSSTLTGE